VDPQFTKWGTYLFATSTTLIVRVLESLDRLMIHYHDRTPNLRCARLPWVCPRRGLRGTGVLICTTVLVVQMWDCNMKHEHTRKGFIREAIQDCTTVLQYYSSSPFYYLVLTVLQYNCTPCDSFFTKHQPTIVLKSSIIS
jgi:hypothetical protein